MPSFKGSTGLSENIGSEKNEASDAQVKKSEW